MNHEFNADGSMGGVWVGDKGQRICTWKYIEAQRIISVAMPRFTRTHPIGAAPRTEVELRTLLPDEALRVASAVRGHAR